jgi:hypothetical protein
MGHLMTIKFVDSRVNVNILASSKVLFTPRMVQVPNLTLTHTERIKVHGVWFCTSHLLSQYCAEGPFINHLLILIVV